MNLQNLTTIEKKGLLLGCLGAMIGALLFSIVNTIGLAIKFTDLLSLFTFLFYYPIALFISIFPSAMIGLLLARQIEKDHNLRSLSKWKSTLRGNFIVSALFIILSGMIGIIIPKMAFEVLIQYATSALIIANLVAGVMSYYLSRYIVNNSNKI